MERGAMVAEGGAAIGGVAEYKWEGEAGVYLRGEIRASGLATGPAAGPAAGLAGGPTTAHPT